MRPNMKFHAIAIAAICVVVTLLYSVIGPSKPEPIDPVVASGRKIEIVTATWGANCNPYIEQAIRDRDAAPVKKDDKGMLIEQKPLNLVGHNNVIDAVKKMCDGKISCDVPLNSELLGVEPLATCFKHLELGYRCYSYDAIQTRDSGQVKAIKITCDETAKTPAK